MKIINLYEIDKWHILKYKNRQFLFEDWNLFTEEFKEHLLDMEYYDLGNGLIVERNSIHKDIISEREK